jgi:cardiolipin synthase
VYSSGSIFKRKKKANADPNQSDWRDTDIQIDGPVVAEFQKLFLATWNKQNGPALAERNYFPALTAQGQDIVRAIGSTPDGPKSLMHLTLVSAVGNAQTTVQITTAYFVPDPALLTALVNAAQRGVEVTLILPSRTDSSLVFHAGRSHYTELLQGGVKIYERLGALLHAKTISIDGVWSTVGSTNLDWRSLHDNEEINAVIVGHDFATVMQTMFAKDLQVSSEVVLDKWEKRPPSMRIKEWFSRLLGWLL